MGKIYIASKPVLGGKEHLYLVYDSDNTFNGNEKVIRGGPIVPFEDGESVDPDHGNIFIDADRLLENSDDRFKPGETTTSQNFTEITLPNNRTAEQVWSDLTNFSKSMGTYNPANQRVETSLDYGIFGPNSNSTIGVILSGGANINIHDNLPLWYGIAGNTLSASTFTGLEDYYVTGNGPKTITISDDYTKVFYDGGNGNTTINIDASNISHQGISFYADGSAITYDKFVLKNVNSNDILLRSYNGTDLWIQDRQGHVIAKLMGQLSSPNKFNSFDVENSDGSIVSFSLPQTRGEVSAWNPLVPKELPPANFCGPADQYQHGQKSISPLVLDLNGNGISVTKLGFDTGKSQVYFDLDNDGFAQRTAWVTGGDGLLAIDKNGNGKIDNQSELFGNNPNEYDGFQIAKDDGFTALKLYDSNKDSKITSADTQFSKLKIWIDADEGGVTDAGELKTLSALGITQISLNDTRPLGAALHA